MTLADDLRALGLARGDRVVVHSSLRAVGARAEEVADALLEVLGEEGLLVVPTFTYDEPGDAPARTGALPEHVRARPGAIRSLHPSYSVAAIGRGAAELLAGHERHAPVARGTPLAQLAEEDGRVLLLGVGHVANTTIHVGEELAGAPYLDIPFDPSWPTHGHATFPGCSRAFGAVERGLRERGALRDGRVGRALAQLVPGRAILDETAALLRADPTALLCTDERCFRCSAARARAAAADPAR